MEIGLFFGSFNPVHNGHMIIANLVCEISDLEQVWLVVSPHNPLKKKSTLANDFDRLHLVNLAIGDNLQLRASNYLHEKYPHHEFALIMGVTILQLFTNGRIMKPW